MYTVYHIKLPHHNIRQGYVGISCNPSTRIRNHFNQAKAGTYINTYLMRAIKKYPEIIVTYLHTGMSLHDALAAEAFYRPVPRIGWNIKAGGLDGQIMSNESKLAISNAHKGKVLSDITKEKLRLANLGKKQSQATKDKRSQTLSKLYKGRPKTTEKEIAALVIGRQGAKNPAAKLANIYSSSGELLEESVCIADYCKSHPGYTYKQLCRTANLNESTKIHKGIYAIYQEKST